jgi:hypothetical protein
MRFEMAVTELERLYMSDPDRVYNEIASAFKGAGRRGLTAEEAGFVVEARLRAVTPEELHKVLTDEECEQLSTVAQLTIDGTTAKNR